MRFLAIIMLVAGCGPGATSADLATASPDLAAATADLAQVGSDFAETADFASTADLSADAATSPDLAVPADSSTSTIAASPMMVVANDVATTTITVTVKDATGNTLAAYPVMLTVSGSGNLLSPTSGASDANGHFVATLASTKAETKTITAHIDGFTLSTTATFIAGAPAKLQTTLVAMPNNVVADGVAMTNVTLTVRDAYSNVVSGQAVSLASSGSANAFAPSASGMTDTNGVFAATLASTKAEMKTITATVGSFTVTTNVTFIGGPATKLVFTTQPQSAAAGVAIPGPPTVAFEDQFSNVTSNGAAALTLTFATNACAGATLAGMTSVTPSAGVATFSSVTVSKMGKGFQLSASGGGLTATSNAFDVTAWVDSNNGLWGGNVSGLAIDPSNPSTLYLASERGVFKSTNAAASWTGLPINTSYVRSVAVDASGIVWAGDGNGAVWKSSDGGATWTSSTLPLGQVWALLIDSAAPSTVHAASAGAVAKTTNGGTTWTTSMTGLPSGVNILALAFDPNNHATLFAVTISAGVFKSTDSGGTWTSITGNLPTSSNSFLSIVVDTTSANTTTVGSGTGIWHTTNGGTTWTQCTGPVGGAAAASLVRDPTTATTIYALDGRLLKSTDGGATFPTVLSSPGGSVLAIHPTSAATMYTGGIAFGVSKSTNGGTTFAAANNGFNAVQIIATAVSATTPATIYAAPNGLSIYKSTDAGATWSSTASPFGGASALAVDPTTPATVYAMATNALYKSINSGASWSAPITMPGIVPRNSFVIDPRTPSTLYAGSQTGSVFKSTNGGTTWTTQSTPSTGEVYVIAIDPVTPTTLYFTDFAANNSLYKTTNGGTTWTAVTATGLPTGTSLISLAIDAAETLYASVNVGAQTFRSTDGGATWTSIGGAVSTFYFGADPTTGGLVYASNVGVVFKTTDAGNTFMRVPANGIVGGAFLFPATLSTGTTLPADTVIAGTGNGGIQKITNVCQ